MKLKEMQRLDAAEMPALNDKFNKEILATSRGRAFLTTNILEKVKWLFVMPVEHFEQLVLNLEQEKKGTEDPDEAEACGKLLRCLEAFLPIKKQLDEAWADIEV